MHRTLRRLCWELKSGCPEITTDIPDDPERLRITFPDFLQQICARLRVVILLDAVDQFDSTSHSDGLHWLPQELPANARIILSTLDGPVLEELRRRSHKPCEIELKPLTAADGEEIIEQFRQRYHKKFELDQIELLVGRDESGDLNKTDSDKPLYLLAALEELRTLGTYEEITRHIAELPPTTLELFAWILERLENDDDFRDVSGRRVGRKLVSRFAALLGASRYGLSQRELSNLLDAGDPQGNVATLLYLLRPYLMRRGELLDFYHRQFRAATAQAWLHTDAQRQAAHRRLADYFRDHADPEKDRSWKGESQRPFLELPFHLSRVSPDELAEILFDYRWLQAKTDKAQVHDLIQDFIDTIRAISSSDMKTRLTRLLVGLEKASGCVVRDPAQLPGQILGRLQGEHQFDRLIDEAKRYEAGPWLRPLLRTLSSAEDPLVWVLEEENSERANWIQAVAISSDNRFVANSSFGFRVNIRDLLTGQILRTFKHPRHSNYERGVVALHFLADRKSLLSASEGGIVIIWDYHSSVERSSFRVSSGITDVTLSSNGDRCLLAGYSSVELWDLAVRERIWTQYDRSEAVAMVDKFDRRLTIHDYQGRLKVQETETGKVLHTLVGHNSWVNAIAVTPDGRRAVSGSRDATIKVWDLQRGDCIRTIDNLKSEIHDLAVSPNGHHIVSVDGNGSIKIWDINTGENLRVFSSVRAIRSLAVSNDGRFAVSGSEDGSVRLWDMNVALRSEKVASMRAEHSFWHGPVAITPDGRRGLAGAYRSLTVWDLEDCKEVHKFLDLGAMVTAIATTPDSRFAVYSFGDFGTLGGIRICDLQTFEEKLVLSCGGFVVRAIAVSADGQWLAYGGSEPYLPPEWGGSFLDNRTRVRLVSWKGTHRRESPYAHQESVTGLVITPDGRRVISSSSDKTIKVWDLQTDRLILTLIGHTAAVNSVAVGHEGRWCISGSADKTIKVWDLTTGQEIRTINGHDGTVTGVATASERDYIVSVSDDRTVKVWNLCDGGAVSAFTAEGPLNACATSGDCRSLIVTDCSNWGPVHFLRLVLPEDHR